MTAFTDITLTPETELFRDLLEGQIFAEGNEMFFVGGVNDDAVAVQRQDRVVVGRRLAASGFPDAYGAGKQELIRRQHTGNGRNRVRRLGLDRRVGHYALPEGWMVVAAGNAAFHGAVSHDMGTALADRMFHFNVQTVIGAFLDYALANDFAPEVMAYLKVRPDRLDDTQAQLANDHLIGASPRGWEDVSNVICSDLSDDAKQVFVQGRLGAANAAEFFGVLRELQAGADVIRLLDARRGSETAALLPGSLDALYGMTYALLAAATEPRTLSRALEIVEQLPEIRSETPLPIREVQTLAMELLFQKALEQGLEGTVLESSVYARYLETREVSGAG